MEPSPLEYLAISPNSPLYTALIQHHHIMYRCTTFVFSWNLDMSVTELRQMVANFHKVKKTSVLSAASK